MSPNRLRPTVVNFLVVLGLLPLASCLWKRPVDIASSSAKSLAPAASGAANSVPKPAIAHVNQEAFDQQVLKSPTPVLVDFYAEWCHPCQQFGPVLEELAAETPGAKIVKVDIDQNRELATRYGIRKIPCVIVFKDGKVAAQNEGPTSKAKLKMMLGG